MRWMKRDVLRTAIQNPCVQKGSFSIVRFLSPTNDRQLAFRKSGNLSLYGYSLRHKSLDAPPGDALIKCDPGLRGQAITEETHIPTSNPSTHPCAHTHTPIRPHTHTHTHTHTYTDEQHRRQGCIMAADPEVSYKTHSGTKHTF